MAEKKFKINLLSQERFEKTKIGRIVTWAITVGRYIVIATELIVIIAFLSRFYFDRVLTDLNEEIKQKLAVVESFATLEKEVEAVHKRTTLAKELLAGELAVFTHISKLGQITPPDVTFELLSFDKQEVKINGIALSKKGAANFLNALKTNPEFTGLNLTNLSSKKSQGEIEFSLAVNFANNQED
ncbi:PilN domain-containing protein [Patescibacteria group bacterium]|nr:PilN domain-containing protein [Patescibacteria group bacterium]